MNWKNNDNKSYGSRDIVVGKAKSMVSFKKSYFFENILAPSTRGISPHRFQSYLSYNYWSRVLGMSDESNPDNYWDYFHKIYKIKVARSDLSY